MVKDEYIRKQLNKTNRKSFESYVVYGIFHFTRHLDVEFTTQQMVIRPNGNRAMMDMFFPSLKLAIEVDEGQHFDSEGEFIETDVTRETDIINAIDCDFERPDATKGLQHLDMEIQRIAKKIEGLHKTIKPTQWEYEKRISRAYYKNIGEIKVGDALYYADDVYSLFGGKFSRGRNPGGYNHSYENNKRIWLPTIFNDDETPPDHFVYRTSISKDENELRMLFPNKASRDAELRHKRITKTPIYIPFVKRKDNLGMRLYKYKGEFEVNLNKSVATNASIVFTRIATKSKVY
ncbi:MAG: hypothetical protein K9H49_10895 [Bacteroidales bacterium]|nr:hypothetical protein [Bacteroidales bacterium]